MRLVRQVLDPIDDVVDDAIQRVPGEQARKAIEQTCRDAEDKHKSDRCSRLPRLKVHEQESHPEHIDKIAQGKHHHEAEKDVKNDPNAVANVPNKTSHLKDLPLNL
jgi:hypothetical protein